MDDEARVLGRTSTTCPRDATKPDRCARSRYGPGDSVRNSKRPLRSVMANAVEPPSADTMAPATGAPFSSCTVPWMEPAAIEATWVIGRICAAPCAPTPTGTQRSTRPPTTADAVILEVLRMSAPGFVIAGYDALTVNTISFVSVLFA